MVIVGERFWSFAIMFFFVAELCGTYFRNQ
jgi:hypothetical protein